MKKIVFVISFLMLSLTTFSCGTQKYDIVATLFPHYDFAKAIVKDKMSVKLLTPIGSEAHSFEPTSKDYMAIEDAKLFIFTSIEFDSSYVNEKMANAHNALNMEESLINHHDAVLISDALHDHDAHYWTNPAVALEMLDLIYNRIIELDPDNTSFYSTNLLTYKTKISDTSQDFKAYLMDKQEKTAYFAGHNALGGFQEYFSIDIVGISASFQPDADITSAEILEMLNKLKSANAKILFIEEIKVPTLAITIQNELGKEYDLKLLELHGYHNLAKEDYEANMTYHRLLERNIMHLKEAIK